MSLLFSLKEKIHRHVIEFNVNHVGIPMLCNMNKGEEEAPQFHQIIEAHYM